MPRRSRRKKQDLPQWQPLTFVSSPLFQAAPILEQEMAATNPVTAKTVPVDDLTETVWVSPQFSQLGHRMLRSSNSMCRRVNSASKGSGVHSAMSLSKRSKFRPLKFVCEETLGDASPCGLKHLRPVCLETVLAQTREESCCSRDDAANVAAYHTAKHCEFSPTAFGINQENANEHSVLASRRKVEEERVLRSGRSVNFGSFDYGKRKSLSEKEGVNAAFSTRTSCIDSDNLNSTALEQQQVTTDSIDCVPCPTSFISTPSRAEVVSNEPSLDLNQSQAGDPVGLQVSSTKTTSGKCLSGNNSGSYDHVCCHNLTSMDRISSEVNFWIATPPRSATNSKIVLALDTPQGDYGLSLRQRQLKYGLREDYHMPLTEPP